MVKVVLNLIINFRSFDMIGYSTYMILVKMVVNSNLINGVGGMKIPREDHLKPTIYLISFVWHALTTIEL